MKNGMINGIGRKANSAAKMMSSDFRLLGTWGVVIGRGTEWDGLLMCWSLIFITLLMDDFLFSHDAR
jgi:hypothetical protein